MQTCRLANSVTVPLLIFLEAWAIVHGNDDPHRSDYDTYIDIDSGVGHWRNASNGSVPPCSVEGGWDGEPLYVGRAEHDGGLIPGAVQPSKSACYIAWGDGENAKTDYQVLCVCCRRWVAVMDGVIPPNAIEVGYDLYGNILYIGRCYHKGALVLGSISELDNTLFISHDGKALGYGEFEILVSG